MQINTSCPLDESRFDCDAVLFGGGRISNSYESRFHQKAIMNTDLMVPAKIALLSMIGLNTDGSLSPRSDVVRKK
jgi:hypothetical protein